MENKELTVYPSIDRPWLKYYDEKAISAPLPKMSMYDYLYECNKDYLDTTALNYFGRKITYRKMFENIDRVAVALQANGVKKGDIVTVCTLTAPETVYLIYAINKVGAVSNMVGLTSPLQDLHEQIKSTDSKLVFAVEMAYDLIVEASKGTKVEKTVSIPIEYSMPTLMKAAASLKQKHPQLQENSVKWADFLDGGQFVEFAPVEFDSADMAVIEYTGGTTGVPKGVMLSSNAMNTYHSNFCTTNSNGWCNYERGDTFLSCIPMFLAFGISSAMHGPLAHGNELVLIPDPDPRAVADTILKTKPNHLVFGPMHIDGLIKAVNDTKTDLSFIKSVMYGGERIDKAWEQRSSSILKQYGMNCPVLNGYGMTETAACVLIATKKLPEGLMPLSGVDVKTIHENTTECRFNEEGELCISSGTLMTGYYQNETETEETLFEENGVKWLRTHDLATITKEGIITITGRIKRIYYKMGADNIQIRVYPMRIEEELGKSDAVERCAVVGIKDNITAYRTIAYIIPKSKDADRTALESELDKLCRENLPDSHVPDKYVFMETFPLTRAGKVDFRTLEKLAEEGE